VESIPVEFQWLSGAAFAVAVAVLAAWSRVFGKKEGPPTQRVQEFYAAGQLADMGPVKELVAAVSLLVTETSASTKAQTRTAEELARLATAYERSITQQEREREIEDEVERRYRDRYGPALPTRSPSKT
jgi:hypothetical protein